MISISFDNNQTQLTKSPKPRHDSSVKDASSLRLISRLIRSDRYLRGGTLSQSAITLRRAAPRIQSQYPAQGLLAQRDADR